MLYVIKMKFDSKKVKETLISEMKNSLEKHINNTTIDLITDAPLDTGALKDSINAELDIDSNNIHVNFNMLYYAEYLEYGTSKMSPQPFAERNLENFKKNVTKEIEDTLEKVLKGVV